MPSDPPTRPADGLRRAPDAGIVAGPSRHPVTVAADEVDAFFTALGFRAHQTPEIEDALHTFDLLGVPADHPTRSPAHTYYAADGRLLRTHTTSSVLRVLRREPGAARRRILVGGPCYRRTTPGPRFVTQFHQMEAAAVGPEVGLPDAIGTSLALLDEMLGDDHGARLRSRALPYVSPGFCVDVPCTPSGCDGCTLCGGRGFVELVSGGVFTAAVARAAGVPDGSTATSVAVSLERLLAIRHGLADIRPFLSPDPHALAALA